MNKNWIKMKNDKRADMGVGTMIIFIAMVLVAAVAASVLISVSNTVREQAQSTGDQAINNVASGFIVQDVIGTVNKTHNTAIDNVTIYLRLASGSPNINMNNVVVTVTTTLTQTVYNATGGSGVARDINKMYTFTKTLVVQASYLSNVMGQGDLAKIVIDPHHQTVGGAKYGLAVGLNQLVTIKIMPAYGQMSLITFVTPEQYSTTYVTLN